MSDHHRIQGGGLELDFTRMRLPNNFVKRYARSFRTARTAMNKLEAGERVNTDEDRQVGHYWLRDPSIAPFPEKRRIRNSLKHMHAFADRIASGKLTGAKGPFRQYLLIGIGGSALGPQMLHEAFRVPGKTPALHFFDNTDPDGMHRTLAEIRRTGGLGRTLTIVVSKSGGTKETRNGMLVAEQAYADAGLRFAEHATAVTEQNSLLDRTAAGQLASSGKPWLERFAMWDWVGGRTSLFSAVGLLPAILTGVNIDALLTGARDMDRVTRRDDPLENPALCLAGVWHDNVSRRKLRNLVVLPYRDRLGLLSKYLQQLVMESIGKQGEGITVFGNKGTTDQHSYIQQLCQGRRDFTALFVRSLKCDDSPAARLAVEPDVTCGDYLAAFAEGTADALTQAGRLSMRITIDRVDETSVGALVALFERTVGYYATMIGINAYHQPGVQAGKHAADDYLELQKQLVNYLMDKPLKPFTAADAAAKIGRSKDRRLIDDMLGRLAANQRFGLSAHSTIPDRERNYSV